MGKRIIDKKFKFVDSNFGLMLDIKEHIPKGCERIRVTVKGEDNYIRNHEMLTNQLYYDKIKVLSDDFKNDISIFPLFESFSIFRKDEEDEDLF